MTCSDTNKIRKGCCYAILVLILISVPTITKSVAVADTESYSFLELWGPSGSSPGKFSLPKSAAVDSSAGKVFVVDTGNHRIQTFTEDGDFIIEWPSEPVPQGTAFYNNPLGVAVDESARIVYVTNAVIQKYDADDGTYLGHIGEAGYGEGQLYGAADIAIDSEGSLYVIDASKNRVSKFSSDGDFITSWGSWCNINGGNPFVSPEQDTSCVDPDGSGPLNPGDGQFNYPNGIVIDSSGNIYVADSGNNRIQKFTADGTFLESWSGQLNFPASVEVDFNDNIYVADNGNYRIVKFSSNGTLLASWGSFGTEEGQFKRQVTAAVNPATEIVYAVDMENDRVQVFVPDIPFADDDEENNDEVVAIEEEDTDNEPATNDTTSSATNEPPPSESPPSEENPTTTPPDGKASVMVWTRVGATNERIDGYYAEVIRESDGFTIRSFSPTSFELDAGEQYTLWVADYGDYVFDYWQDTSSNDRQRTLMLGDGETMEVTAMYRDINNDDTTPPLPPPKEEDEEESIAEESSIHVKSVDSDGDEIYGYFTVLYEDGDVQSTGFTPASFETISGEQYTVEVQDYGDYFFDHWLDNDSTVRQRTFTASDSNLEFTAVYSRTAEEQQEEEEEPSLPPAPAENGTATLNIRTVDASGNEIYGYYTTLWHGTQLIEEGFSPVSFTVEADQSYAVAVADYGSYHFDHWSDGNDSNFMSLNPEPGQTISLTAVYRID